MYGNERLLHARKIRTYFKEEDVWPMPGREERAVVRAVATTC